MHGSRTRTAARHILVLKIAIHSAHQTGPVRERLKMDRQRTFPIKAAQRTDTIAHSGKQNAERHTVMGRIAFQLCRRAK